MNDPRIHTASQLLKLRTYDEDDPHDMLFADAAYRLTADGKRIKELEAMLHEVREIYISMDGVKTKTAPENYLMGLIYEMYKEAGAE